jgi:hypothetical protein
MDVKQALRDARFRDSLPSEFKEDVHQYLKNPGCACNLSFYKRILKDAAENLKAYFPGREVGTIEEEVKKMAENKFSVINCHKNELEYLLRQLPPGRKQLAITRYEDQITVIVNELDLVY